ncbi:hypothetical protein [Moraxella oculi]|uniref:Uncharacterized protein n=1 Tax=Moraxella oculi TaxID=2940516 RepID=A0ABW8U3S2_9GAMM
MLTRLLPDAIVPKDIPKTLILLLIVLVLLIGLSGFRLGGGDRWQGFLHVLENWLVSLVFIPACTALVALPIKYRDTQFDIKMAYYLGMFVSFLFMVAKLRYWR